MEKDILWDSAVIRPICLKCKHLKPGFSCVAFPNGIPDDIVYDGEKHDTVRPDQIGKTVFEPEAENE